MTNMIETPERQEQEEVVQVHEDGHYEERVRVAENVNAARRTAIARVTGLIYLMFSALEALLGLRVLLKLMAANPDNAFARLIYGLSEPFVWPFQGLTVTPAAQGIVLEIHSIFAIFVYALVGWGIVRLIWLVFYWPATRSVARYERETMRRR